MDNNKVKDLAHKLGVGTQLVNLVVTLHSKGHLRLLRDHLLGPYKDQYNNNLKHAEEMKKVFRAQGGLEILDKMDSLFESIIKEM